MSVGTRAILFSFSRNEENASRVESSRKYRVPSIDISSIDPFFLASNVSFVTDTSSNGVRHVISLDRFLVHSRISTDPGLHGPSWIINIESRVAPTS